MQNDTEPVALVERFFAGIAEGSAELALSVMADDVEWTPTLWSGTGTYWGIDQVRGWLLQFGPSLEGLRLEVRSIEPVDGGVFTRGIVHDSRQGVAFATQIAAYFEAASGKIIRGQAFSDVEAARAAAGLPSRHPRSDR